MASRELEDLHKYLRPLADLFLKKLKDADIDVLVTCTYRSNQEQDSLYEQGRTKPGSIVTNARGGQSEHNFMVDGKPSAKAFDIVPISNGKCMWDTSHTSWKSISNIWKDGVSNDQFYLDWYGRPDAIFREYPHFCLKEKK